jgi:hypothetical protein
MREWLTDRVLGAKSGPGYHARYFQLKKFSEEQRKRWVGERRGAYTRYVDTIGCLEPDLIGY